MRDKTRNVIRRAQEKTELFDVEPDAFCALYEANLQNRGKHSNDRSGRRPASSRRSRWSGDGGVCSERRTRTDRSIRPGSRSRLSLPLGSGLDEAPGREGIPGRREGCRVVEDAPGFRAFRSIPQEPAGDAG